MHAGRSGGGGAPESEWSLMRTVAIVNQKGGCGKTTTAINLAALLAHRGYQTLLVDLDPQSHCAAGLGVPEDKIEMGIGQAMLARHDASFDADTLLWEVNRHLSLAPSTMMLSALEAPGGGLHELPDRDRRLSGLLRMLASRFQWCIIDSPPTIGLLTFNALRACDEALVPVETGFFSLKGATRQWGTIRSLIDRIGRPIACHMVATLHRPESERSCRILQALQRTFPEYLLPVVLREHESLREAASMGQPIVSYAPGSDAERNIAEIVDWLEAHPIRRSLAIDPDPLTIPTPTQPTTRAAELVARVRDLASVAAGCSLPMPSGKRASPEPQPSPPTITLSTHQRRPFGAVDSPDGICFRQPGPNGQIMAIAGDFNGWSTVATPMAWSEHDQAYEVIVTLPPGRHRYAVVVDGRAEVDVYNTTIEPPSHDTPARSAIDVPSLQSSE
jgi:chromosome partitioning protein